MAEHWKQQGLLLLQQSAASESQRTLIREAIENAAALFAAPPEGARETRAQRKRRRGSPLDRLTSTGATEHAFTFLNPAELGRLARCSKSTSREAMGERLWSRIRDSCFPETDGTVRVPGTAYETCRRMRNLWTGHHESWRHTAEPGHVFLGPRYPGVEAYLALIKFNHSSKGVFVVAAELEQHHLGDRFLIRLAEEAEAAFLPLRIDADGDARGEEGGAGNYVTPEDKTEHLFVSIALVRKSDERFMHICTEMVTIDADDDGVYFGLGASTVISCVTPFYVGHSLGTLEAIGEDIETFGFEHQVHFENCTAPEVGVPGKRRRLLSSLGNFTLHIWTAGESHARLPCWHVLQGWHASKDWC